MTRYVKNASTVMLEWINADRHQIKELGASCSPTGEHMSINDRMLNERLDDWIEYFERLKQREIEKKAQEESDEKNKEKPA